jgi:hypothetical protein
MSDIVERLLSYADDAADPLVPGDDNIIIQAADEIERLRAERDRLRRILKLAEDVLSRPPWSNNMLADGRHPHGIISEIRTALKEAGGE